MEKEGGGGRGGGVGGRGRGGRGGIEEQKDGEIMKSKTIVQKEEAHLTGPTKIKFSE